MPIQGLLKDQQQEMHKTMIKKEYNQEVKRIILMIEVEKMSQYKVLEELQVKTQD